MGEIKLKKYGNSYGFTIPQKVLKELSFGLEDDFELLVDKDVISIIKRRPHHSEWKFQDTELSEEDYEWLDADLGALDHE